MKTGEIISLLKRELDGRVDDNCHLYLWVTNNFLQDGLEVVRQIGFRYVTLITWMKDRISLGQYFRGITEHYIFAVKGNLPYKVSEGKRQQGVTGFTEKKREHSRKPERAYEMIEVVSYPPRLEMFARERREGWDVWGNELPNHVQRKLIK
jgi:N6-adenosine-specific RNA methylase IME4